MAPLFGETTAKAGKWPFWLSPRQVRRDGVRCCCCFYSELAKGALGKLLGVSKEKGGIYTYIYKYRYIYRYIYIGRGII